jgi:competence protein ComEA
MRSRVGSSVIAAAIAIVAPIVLAQTPAGQPSATAEPSNRFPPGPGRDALFKACKECHGPESVLGQLKTHDEWSKTLDEMANAGAQASDQEWNQILAYLTQHFSLIFVNKAPAADLASTLDVSEEGAQAIVQVRTERGQIKTIEELKKVPGLDGAKIDARKDRLIF